MRQSHHIKDISEWNLFLNDKNHVGHSLNIHDKGSIDRYFIVGIKHQKEGTKYCLYFALNLSSVQAFIENSINKC